jgi:hypothetical protein
MSFNPNTDTNWAQVVVALNKLPGPQADNFKVALIQYLCNDVTNTTTINAAEFTNGITQALFTAQHENVRNF